MASSIFSAKRILAQAALLLFFAFLAVPRLQADHINCHYDDGGVHTLDFVRAEACTVSNATTVNYVSGGSSQMLWVDDTSVVNLSGTGAITNGGFSARDSSTITISENASITGSPGFEATNDATLNISGGTLTANTNFIVTDNSETTISGGTFNCNGTGPCWTALGNSTLSISDGLFADGITATGTPSDHPHVTISGGTFEGASTLWATHSIMDIFGGSFDDVRSLGHISGMGSTVTIYGSGFQATCTVARTNRCDAGEVYLNGYGVIEGFAFDGTITGILSDGTPLDVTALLQALGGSGSEIILAATIPVPPAVWLFGSALAMLGWVRRRKLH